MEFKTNLKRIVAKIRRWGIKDQGDTSKMRVLRINSQDTTNDLPIKLKLKEK